MSDSVRPHRRQPTRLCCPWDSPGKNTGVGCHFLLQCMKVKSGSEVAQLCPTVCYPMDCSLPGSSVCGDSPGKNTGVGCQVLLQGIFPTQGSNPCLPPRRQILYQLSHKNAGVGSLSLLQQIFPTQESNRGLLHCRQILYQLSYQGSSGYCCCCCCCC